MRSADEITRAQARALIRVFRDYGLERQRNTDAISLWRAIEAYGHNEPRALDLPRIIVEFRHAIRTAGGLPGSPNRVVRYGLLPALYAFCYAPLVHRFHPAAVAVVGGMPNPGLLIDRSALQAEIFEKLEDAFDDEMFPKEAA